MRSGVFSAGIFQGMAEVVPKSAELPDQGPVGPHKYVYREILHLKMCYYDRSFRNSDLEHRHGKAYPDIHKEVQVALITHYAFINDLEQPYFIKVI